MTNTGGAAMVAIMRRAERQVVETLRQHGALSADRAVPLALRRPGGKAALRRLVRSRSVREAGDRYWLDETAYEAMGEARRIRGVFALIIVGLIVAGIIAFGVLQARAQTVDREAGAYASQP